MSWPAIEDPLFRDAVAAIDGGDLGTLRRLVAAHPALVRERVDYGEGYFRRPYLLWFVAENPVRNGTLPANIVEVARTIVDALARLRIDSRQQQLDYALGLVCSGRVTRECGAQRPLVDLLVDSGASPDGALLPALAHRELDAVTRLLERGARLTLTAAVCTGRIDAVTPLWPLAGDKERRAAVNAAALYGDTRLVALLLDLGGDANGYGPPDFHPHATPLHQAVYSRSLAAVRLLVESGAALDVRDRAHHSTPLEWAEYLEHAEIAGYLREQRDRQ